MYECVKKALYAKKSNGKTLKIFEILQEKSIIMKSWSNAYNPLLTVFRKLSLSGMCITCSVNEKKVFGYIRTQGKKHAMFIK